eukprot:2214593-Heterocapsa_arctica.AAC.1
MVVQKWVVQNMVVQKWGGSETGGSEMEWFSNWVVQNSRFRTLRPARTPLRPEQLCYVPENSSTS